MSKTKKITMSGVVIALYVSIMFFTQSIAFGAIQIRFATGLYALAALYPFLVVPLGLSNLLSNIVMGGLGPLDAIGGLCAGLLTSFIVCRFKNNNWIILLAIIFIPGLLVPIWLAIILNIPYYVLAVSVCLGQVIPAALGLGIVSYIKSR